MWANFTQKPKIYSVSYLPYLLENNNVPLILITDSKSDFLFTELKFESFEYFYTSLRW